MTPDELIAETLRLDGEATKGPWRFVRPGRVESTTTGLSLAFCGPAGIYKNGSSVRTTEDQCEWNAITVAHNRTAAPLLARMLRAAIAGLTVVRDRIGITDQQDASRADATLAEIDRIAKEEA